VDAITRHLTPQCSLFGDSDAEGDRRIIPIAAGREILSELAAKLADPPKIQKRPPPMMRHVLLIDGRAVLDAAYYATQHEDKRTDDGVPNGAVSGYANVLMQLLRRTQPSHIVAAFDHPEGANARKRMLAGYKARPDKQLDHLAQIDLSMRLTRLLGIQTIYSAAGEADDVIATAIGHCPEGQRVTVFSPDKDLLQLVGRDGICVLWRRRGEWQETSGQEGALARLGVRCDQVPDFLALMGDATDNVPGCPGIGEKTAQRLLQAHGTLDGIRAAFGRLNVPNAARIEGLLRDGWAQVLMARAVVVLRTDLEDPQLPRDAWDLCRDCAWAWDSITLEALELFSQQIGIPWLPREVKAMRSDQPSVPSAEDPRL
jgi:5'-3' exonuclease